MPTELTPIEWFDQFSEDIKSGAIQGNDQWCARHWAPCPVLGANGIGATIAVVGAWLGTVPPESRSPKDLNRTMDAVGPMCCALGDERMYEIWGNWPPTVPPEAVRDADPR